MTAAVTTPAIGESITTAGRMRSIEATRAIANVDGITKTERNVLYVLAQHAGEGEKGLECYPAIRTIAAKAHICERQAKRVVRSLRQKRVISFEDNVGGKHKSNRYVLLYANGEIPNSDTSSRDKCKGDIVNTCGDKSSTQTVTNVQQRVAFQSTNGAKLLSPEGFEWYEGFPEWEADWKNQTPFFQSGRGKDFSSNPSKFLCYLDVVAQVDEFENRPEDLLQNILKGTRIQRNQKCDHHGTFLRPGYRFGNWIAWAGHESMYSSTWTNDAGCHGCKSEHDELWKDEPKRKLDTLPVRQFDLKTPATCPDHGHFIFRAYFTEYSEEYARIVGRKLRVEMDYINGCPGCDGDSMYEEQLRDDLGLSWEEWQRGGKRIIAAIEFAQEKPSESQKDAFVVSATVT